MAQGWASTSLAIGLTFEAGCPLNIFVYNKNLHPRRVYGRLDVKMTMVVTNDFTFASNLRLSTGVRSCRLAAVELTVDFLQGMSPVSHAVFLDVHIFVI